MNTLVKACDIKRIYGVAKKTVWQWSSEPTFPRPILKNSIEKKWDRAEVDAWVNVHCTRSGVYGRWHLIKVERVKEGSEGDS